MTTTERKVRLKDGMLAQSVKNKAAPGIVVPLVKEHLLSNHTADFDRRWDIIHPSEMAKPDWCHRATYDRIFNNLPPALEKFDFFQESIFGEGNAAHTKWQTWLQETGKLWGDWHCALCNDTLHGCDSPNVNEVTSCKPGMTHWWMYDEIPLGGADSEFKFISGHADGALDRTMVEFKTVGLGTVRIDSPDLYYRFVDGRKTDIQGLWRAIEKPLKSHLNQGDIYLWLAQKMGYDFPTMSYVYEFKPTQQVKEFPVKFDVKRIQKLLDKADEIVYALQRESYSPPDCVVEGCRQCISTAAPAKKKRRVVKDAG